MMKVIANKKGLAALMLSLILVLSLAACGSENKAYDDLLAAYEKFVVQVEDLPGTTQAFTAEKIQEVRTTAQDFTTKAQELTAKVKPTDAQAKKLTDLGNRLAAAMQKIATLPATEPVPLD